MVAPSPHAMRCNICVESGSIAACRNCGALICPAHRWSTGNADDGYYCVDSLCAPVDNLEVILAPSWPPAAVPMVKPRLTAWVTTVAFLTIALVIAYWARGS